jgi:hypothetical protein
MEAQKEQKHRESIKHLFPPDRYSPAPQKPCFNDDAVLSEHRNFIDKFAPDELRDALKARAEYPRGRLHRPLVFYATMRTLQIRGGGQMPLEDFHSPLQSLPMTSYLWRMCERDIERLLPIVFASLSASERKIVILGSSCLWVVRVVSVSGWRNMMGSAFSFDRARLLVIFSMRGLSCLIEQGFKPSYAWASPLYR